MVESVNFKERQRVIASLTLTRRRAIRDEVGLDSIPGIEY